MQSRAKRKILGDNTHTTIFFFFFFIFFSSLPPSITTTTNYQQTARPARAEATLSSSSSSSRISNRRSIIGSSSSSRCRRTTPTTAPLVLLVSASAGTADADALLGGGGGGGILGGGGGGKDGTSKPRSTDEADDDDGDGDDGEEVYLDATAAAAAAASKGIALPADFLAAASSEGGLRASALASYAALFGSAASSRLSPASRLLASAFPFVRDRLMRDPRYLFKVGAEVAIDAGCATVAEVRKRGDDFWGEFEFYLSDLVVGCVLDVVLVTLMAPAAQIGRGKRASASAVAPSNFLSSKVVEPLRRAAARVPSAVLEANVPGSKPYTASQRAGCLAVKFGEYSLAGMGCGLVGQSVANAMMAAKRALSERNKGRDPNSKGKKNKQPEIVHLTPPPVGMTALTWGLFMGVSSNVRYQIVYGLERLVDVTVATKLPAAAYVATLAFRFANNVIGGENFIDMARWTGIQ